MKAENKFGQEAVGENFLDLIKSSLSGDIDAIIYMDWAPLIRRREYRTKCGQITLRKRKRNPKTSKKT